MKTKDFREIVVDRFLEFTDEFPDTTIVVVKEMLAKNIFVTIEYLDRSKPVSWFKFIEVLETIQVISNQTKYDVVVWDMLHREESYTLYRKGLADIFKPAELKVRIQFIHNPNSK